MSCRPYGGFPFEKYTRHYLPNSLNQAYFLCCYNTKKSSLFSLCPSNHVFGFHVSSLFASELSVSKLRSIETTFRITPTLVNTFFKRNYASQLPSLQSGRVRAPSIITLKYLKGFLLLSSVIGILITNGNVQSAFKLIFVSTSTWILLKWIWILKNRRAFIAFFEKSSVILEEKREMIENILESPAKFPSAMGTLELLRLKTFAKEDSNGEMIYGVSYHFIPSKPFICQIIGLKNQRGQYIPNLIFLKNYGIKPRKDILVYSKAKESHTNVIAL